MASIRRDLGFDQPPAVRYVRWLAGAMRGDPGTSFAQANIGSFTGSQSGQAGVAAQIAPGFAITMFLVGVTAIIAVPLALTLGIVAALYRNSAFDSVANILSLLSISSPEFFLPTS